MILTPSSLLAGATPIILGLGQAYLAYRLRQQDDARDAARAEAASRDAAASEQRDAIHVLVNSRMSATLERVEQLEEKLGLAHGEEIPSAAIVTRTEDPEAAAQ